MNRMRFLTLGVLALSACGEPPSECEERTPRASLEKFRDALTDQDWGAVYDLTPPSERAAFERHWESEKSGTGRDFRAYSGALGGSDLRDLSYREVFLRILDWMAREQVDALRPCPGSECTVAVVEGARCRVRCRDGDRERKLLLLREEASWFVSGLHALAQRTARKSL